MKYKDYRFERIDDDKIVSMHASNHGKLIERAWNRSYHVLEFWPASINLVSRTHIHEIPQVLKDGFQWIDNSRISEEDWIEEKSCLFSAFSQMDADKLNHNIYFASKDDSNEKNLLIRPITETIELYMAFKKNAEGDANAMLKNGYIGYLSWKNSILGGFGAAISLTAPLSLFDQLTEAILQKCEQFKCEIALNAFASEVDDYLWDFEQKKDLIVAGKTVALLENISWEQKWKDTTPPRRVTEG